MSWVRATDMHSSSRRWPGSALSDIFGVLAVLWNLPLAEGNFPPRLPVPITHQYGVELVPPIEYGFIVGIE